jgi:multiple antibiotic resistance protein
MISFEEIVSIFIILWAVIDPVGTIPVFIAITKSYNKIEKASIALKSSFIAAIILVFFLLVGEYVLRNVGVPISAFQTSGGVILFLFAINMIFGSSKPEEEIQLVKNGTETAIFPLAIPSIASPGAILAVVLLAEKDRHNLTYQVITFFLLILILIINYILMRASNKIHEKIGNSGAIVISKVMGLILASMAANNILLGIKEFFKIKV